MANTVNIDDVVLYRVEGTNFSAPIPKDDEDNHMVAIKAFVMTCLHRRNVDPKFDHDMKAWLEAHSSEELFEKDIVKRYN